MKKKSTNLPLRIQRKICSVKTRPVFLNWCIAASVVGVQAESLIEQIGWEGAPTRIIIAVGLVLVSLLTIMAVLYLRMRHNMKKDQSDVSNRLFNELCTKSDLYPSEVRKLQQLLTHEVITFPHTIFQSAALFERCVDAEIRLLLLGTSDPESLADDEKTIATIRKKLGYSYLPLEHPLLSTRNLEIGQVVTVFTLKNTAPLIQRAVVISNKETGFRIEYDTEKDGPFQILAGQEIKLAFARQGDGVYGVQVEIAGADDATIDCLHTLDFRRNQMRQYARIELNLPIRVRPVPAQKTGVTEAFPQHVDAKLCDISGGGLSFIYEKPFVPGDDILMHFSLSTGKFSAIPGRILRVNLQEGKTTTWYRHHIQFIDIAPQHRDRIIKYIFEKQRQINQMR